MLFTFFCHMKLARIVQNITLTSYLTSWSHLAFDLYLCPFTSVTFDPWTCVGSYNLFGSIQTCNFSNEVNFTFRAHISTWPLMTVDLGKWPLTAWTYKGSHNLPIMPLLHLILQNDLRWNFILMWPLTSSTNESFHAASMTQLWLKSIKACERAKFLTRFYNRQWTKRSLCVFPANKMWHDINEFPSSYWIWPWNDLGMSTPSPLNT